MTKGLAPRIHLPRWALILSVLSLTTASATASANDWSLGGKAGFELGMSVRDLGILSNALNNTGMGNTVQLGGAFVTVGGEGYLSIGKLVVGGSGHVLLGPGQSQGTQQYSLSGSEGFFHAGWEVWNWNELTLTPLLGVGLGGMSSLFQDPENVTSEEAQWSSVLFDASAIVDYSYLFYRREGEILGPRIGLKFGYTFSPVQSVERYLNGVSVGTFPGIDNNYSVHSFHIQLVVGATKATRKKKVAAPPPRLSPIPQKNAMPADPVEKEAGEDTMVFGEPETNEEQPPKTLPTKSPTTSSKKKTENPY